MDVSTKPYWYKASVTRIYDADTIWVDLFLGLDVVLAKVSLRLAGIDAWELRGSERKEGLKAKAVLLEILKEKEIIVQTIKDRTGKYGRYLAKIYLPPNTEFTDPNTGEVFKFNEWLDINSWLVDQGYAVVY